MEAASNSQTMFNAPPSTDPLFPALMTCSACWSITEPTQKLETDMFRRRSPSRPGTVIWRQCSTPSLRRRRLSKPATPLACLLYDGAPRLTTLLFQRCSSRTEQVKTTNPQVKDETICMSEETGELSTTYCDVCILSIPPADLQNSRRCELCRGGDFDICRHCFARGARCLDGEHCLSERGDEVSRG